MNKSASSRVILLLALCLVPPLAGCLVSHSANEKISGNYVPTDTFDRIEPGKTTSTWVKATLGEPTSKESSGSGTEVWKYSYTEEKESSGAIFLIFGGTDKKEQQRVAYVEIKDGTVTNKWRA